ncbi:head-tail connector protein [Clostridium cagae]|uniref:Phage gp6-like head-tail connector protein n=1 Tax=Clostridium botulinum TaxID=1491 RepID=A0A6B4JKD2_CLOBO|nr:head-tail connector protein [Clostridium botulinum]EES50811.1 conserved hypothetical protein [Clostridium botulinum E1 str. 'BoNT E Beluga']MBY6760797.1 phage gp6-like head-tail connector protein [Clostridium botulinum]MBY6835979.1 phage gp6-like head-tail connector protein [Clostridium botulinum]MBY6919911.1 phage gp6-like head-tail connector protein [Clostridium botulinum]MBY6929802.1 phage gp6-like head-tail connector protein [Clostridium botulinum]
MILEDIKEYLRLDYDDEDKYLQELIEISDIYIDSMVGEGYKIDAKAVKLANLLKKKIISDMFENRSTHIEGANNLKRDIIVTSILDKLALYGDVNE